MPETHLDAEVSLERVIRRLEKRIESAASDGDVPELVRAYERLHDRLVNVQQRRCPPTPPPSKNALSLK